jgi:signal peptidase I
MSHNREFREVMAIRKRHPSRDAIEGIIYVAILYLMFRHFVVEVFKIPTGSMSPTLQGQHRDLLCPNCDYGFPVDGGVDDQGMVKAVRPLCPNCGYEFREEDVAGRYCSCFPAKPGRIFWRGDNRVIVSKLIAKFQWPKRWDVVVFRYPEADYRCLSCGATYKANSNNGAVRCPECGSALRIRSGKTFIKRLIGLPGEDLMVRHGDIYINGALARKPREVQKDLWQMVYDSRYVAKRPLPRMNPRWEGVGGIVQEDGQALKLGPATSEKARANYLAYISDFTAYNGWRPQDILFPPGDLRWNVRVRTSAPGIVDLAIREDEVEYVASVSFGAGDETIIKANGEVIARSGFSADPVGPHDVAFANWDDTLLLTVDGKEVLSLNHPVEAAPESYMNGAALGVSGAEATFEHVRLERDLYYIQRHRQDRNIEERDVAHIPAKNYFFMGDNTRNSSDGRYWGTVPEKDLVGRARVLWWPFDRYRPVE